MKLDRHYSDPRLVELYDLENTRGPDTDFYLSLAAELRAETVLDLGCGTGLLALELARTGRTVTGVDPSAAMLGVARRQPDAERVRWIEGDASALGTPAADLLVMTGNVAQVFLEDEAWAAALRDIHTALRPGGYVAFESRNPAARAWEHWNPEESLARLETPFGPVETWLRVLHVLPEQVLFEGHNRFLETGEVLVSTSELRFRSRAELTDSLARAGFAVRALYGDWARGPFLEGTSRFMVFVAQRP